MPALQGGEPAVAAALEVMLGADPQGRAVQDAERRRQNAFPAELLTLECGGDLGTGSRERGGEFEGAGVLAPIAAGRPVRVVDVLPAPRIVSPDGLDVSLRMRGDPDIAPGRWNDEILYALQFILGRLGAIGIAVVEAGGRRRALKAGVRAGLHPCQSRHLPKVQRPGQARASCAGEAVTCVTIVATRAGRSPPPDRDPAPKLTTVFTSDNDVEVEAS